MSCATSRGGQSRTVSAINGGCAPASSRNSRRQYSASRSAPNRATAAQNSPAFPEIRSRESGSGRPAFGYALVYSRRRVREFLDVRAHFLRTERAVQSDDERMRVRDRNQKCFDGLSAQHPARQIGHRPGNHQRNFPAAFLERFRDGDKRRLGIQRIENGFDQEQIDPAFQQSAHLIAIRLADLIERDGAKTRIVHVRGKRTRHRHRSERTGHKSSPTGRRSQPRPPLDARVCAATTFISCTSVAQLRVVDHALKKLRIFPSVSRLPLKEKIVQARASSR